MLYWIWFVGLSLLGWWFAFRQYRHAAAPQQDGSMSRSGAARWMSWGAMLLALLVSWNGVGREVVGWLEGVVPQAGTDIHTLTVGAVVAALCVVWIVFPSFIATRLSGGVDNRPESGAD